MAKELGDTKPNRSHRTIRSQLLFAVNGSLAVVIAVFLVFDYRQGFEERLGEKRVALEEEAKTLLPAVLEVSPQGADAVQSYIDAVCAQMQDFQSPGHHIAVEFEDETLQAVAHHRASPEILQAMREAARTPGRSAPIGQTELVVGSHGRSGATVYVSETLDNLRQAARGDVIARLFQLAVLAIVSAIVVNVVLWRMVTRPLDRLVATVREIATGRLGTRTGQFHSAELAYLADEINAMSESLAEADQQRSLQMAKARKIQQHLLPGDVDTPGLEVACLFEPAEDVAGDYYDLLPLADGTFLLCVADVTGHGVPAAMSAAMLKALLAEASERWSSPRDILDFINRRYFEISLPGDFVSMILLQACPRDGWLRYASAGHETALLRLPSGEVRELTSTGLLLGVLQEADWNEEKLAVQPGTRLLMVTDGVTEMFDSDGKLFGRDRLAKAYSATADLTAGEAAEHMRVALAGFRQGHPCHDDVTLVVVDFCNELRLE